jgi:hypothetical protein
VELEAWYWGDLLAVEQAFGIHNLQSLSGKSKYRIPDSIVNPKDELRKHIPRFEQLDGAKRMAKYAEIDRNTSKSFQVFIKSLQDMVNRDTFDYTEWRRNNLCKGMTIDEIYDEAAATYE